MQVDALALDLRPRAMPEAADLGVRLVQSRALSVWRSFAPTYAVVLHRTFRWKLPHEAKTVEFFQSRQGEDGAFFAWTRGGHYFSAHAKGGPDELNAFVLAFPY